MSRPIYRRGAIYAATIHELVFLSSHPEHDPSLNAYQLALVRSAREGLTPRELECLNAYYVRCMGMTDIARELSINVSTVSRNLSRAEGKVDRMIKLAREISPIRFPGREK